MFHSAGLCQDGQCAPGSVGAQFSLGKKGAVESQGDERNRSNGGARHTGLEATWMGLEILIQREVKQRKTDPIQHSLYVESKHICTRTYLQNRNSLAETQDKLMVPRAGGGGDK